MWCHSSREGAKVCEVFCIEHLFSEVSFQKREVSFQQRGANMCGVLPAERGLKCVWCPPSREGANMCGVLPAERGLICVVSSQQRGG